MLLQRDVLLLAASYFCMNYVFYMFAQWLFIYLVEARGFSLLESGCCMRCRSRRAPRLRPPAGSPAICCADGSDRNGVAGCPR